MTTVTDEDIAKGQPQNFFSCPLSKAISRETRKSVGFAWGSMDGIDPLFYPMLFLRGKWRFVHMPLEVLNWINDFDRKISVQPISFEWEEVA